MVANTLRVALFLSACLWLSVFSVTFQEQVSHSETAGRALGVFFDGYEYLDLQWTTPIFWPSESFKAHAVACAGTEMFVANLYQILRVDIGTGHVKQVPCDLNGTI